VGSCKKRYPDGSCCGLPDAEYGVTIEAPAFKRYYTIMVCKKHWLEYLSDPEKFVTEHELGSMQWLVKEGPGAQTD